jgi:LysR family transcriptional regulator, low CO2-responsive transcriptional regulator
LSAPDRAVTVIAVISLTFRQLEVFVQFVEAGGASACADKLGISQVSVNEHLKALEQHCGAPLIVRRRGVRPALTDAGERTYRKARELLEGAAELTGGSSETRRAGDRRKIRIAAHEFIAERAGPALAGFMSAFPYIDLQTERRPFEGVLRGLQDGELELGAFLSFGPVPEIESFCAGHEEVALYVGESHPLARQEAVDPAELAKHAFIHLPPHTHIRKQFDALLRAGGVGEGPVVMTGDSMSLAVRTIAKGAVVCCLFVNMPKGILKHWSLHKVRLSCDLPKIDVRYAIRSPFHQDAMVQQLAQAIRNPKPI